MKSGVPDSLGTTVRHFFVGGVMALPGIPARASIRYASSIPESPAVVKPVSSTVRTAGPRDVSPGYRRDEPAERQAECQRHETQVHLQSAIAQNRRLDRPDTEEDDPVVLDAEADGERVPDGVEWRPDDR